MFLCIWFPLRVCLFLTHLVTVHGLALVIVDTLILSPFFLLFSIASSRSSGKLHLCTKGSVIRQWEVFPGCHVFIRGMQRDGRLGWWIRRGSQERGNFTAGLLLSHSGRKCCRFVEKIEMVSVQEQSIEPCKAASRRGLCLPGGGV